MRFKLGQKIIDKIRCKKIHKASPSNLQFEYITYIVDKLINKKNVKTIFEFGSRYGEDTIEFAKYYSDANIYSYECNPNTIKKCKNNVAKFNNIIFNDKAISDEVGETYFYPINKNKTKTTWIDGNQGASSLFQASGEYKVEDYQQDKVVIKTTTLKQEMETYHIDCIDLIWMDVQGAELNVLKGLKDRIKDVKIFQIETEFMEIYKEQPLFNEILDFLSNNDFIYIGNLTESQYSCDAVFVNKIFFSEKDIFELDMKKLPINLPKDITKMIKTQNINFYLYNKKPSEVPIDIIIPAVSKDIHKLNEVVKSIRENVLHPIKNIYIVSPRGISEDFCQNNNSIFVDEDTILPIKVTDIEYSPRNLDRSGWIFQQLIKLNADEISDSEYILIVDSDTFFATPQSFIYNNKMILNCSDEYHLPYFETIQKVSNLTERFHLSFVSHHILFNAKYLKELKNEIKTKTGENWWKAIIGSLNQNEISSFSEYELYGNYVYFNHKNNIELRYWHNLKLTDRKFKDISDKEKECYKTISLHSYDE